MTVYNYKTVKADFHIHNQFDYMEKHFGIPVLPHPCEYIDMAVEKGFQVLSFTNHGLLFDDPATFEYARKNNILLIPGEEAFIENKHVLLYNFPRQHINTFSELKKYVGKKRLVIAPHPFFPGKFCLKDKLFQYIDFFDAIEHCHFHAPGFNLNKKAIEVARKYDLPLVGSSDAHTLQQFGKTYSLLKVKELSIKGVFDAIRAQRVEIQTTPLSLWEIIRYYLYSRRWVHKLRKISRPGNRNEKKERD